MTESLLDNSQGIDPKNYLSELVGEGRKYKDYEALAKGNYHGDIHIRNLETRVDEMREDLLKEQSEKMALQAQLIELQQLTSNALPVVKEVSQPTIKTEDIQSLISSELPKYMNAYETERRQKQNFETVKAKLIEAYGHNYGNAYQEKINSLGLSAEQADVIAQGSPQAFITMLGLDQPVRQSFQAPPKSSVQLGPVPEQKKTRSFYVEQLKEMRKTNPHAYYSPQTLVEMDKMAQSLGEEFFDTD